MADEIELKFEIKDYEKLVGTLKEVSEFKNSAYEITIMYDENGKLFKKDARLRLRRMIDIKTNEEKTEISYKKPKTREGIKIEEEYETSVGNFDEIEQVLKNIGFEKVSSYERIRDTFVKGGMKITIDSFPFGDYLEVEGELEDIKKFAEERGLDMNENITKSCDDIYYSIQTGKGKEVSDHILFEDKDHLDQLKQKRTVLLE